MANPGRRNPRDDAALGVEEGGGRHVLAHSEPGEIVSGGAVPDGVIDFVVGYEAGYPRLGLVVVERSADEKRAAAAIGLRGFHQQRHPGFAGAAPGPRKFSTTMWPRRSRRRVFCPWASLRLSSAFGASLGSRPRAERARRRGSRAAFRHCIRGLATARRTFADRPWEAGRRKFADVGRGLAALFRHALTLPLLRAFSFGQPAAGLRHPGSLHL